jgi:hypothetical protein
MREFNLSKIKAAGTTVGDVYFPQTTLLLPFDGANGATTTSDSSDENRTITLAGADISTAQSKFGGSSLSVTNGSGSNICSWETAVDLGTIFTVEYWFRRTGSTTHMQVAGCILNLASFGSGAWPGGCGLLLGYVDTGTSANKLILYASSNGTSWDQASAAQISDFPVLNTWEHRALVRNGANWHYYVNGTRTYTTSAGGSAALWTGGSKCSVGRPWYGSANAPGALGGNYDDFRITNGVERYSGASFTPPSTAHLTSAGDVNKQIIINSTADGVAIGTGGINQARIAKAWVNFNGTGTVAIRSSYNISSITDQATGFYVANFSTAMANHEYCATVSSGWNTVTWGIPMFGTISGESTPFTASKVGVTLNSPADTDTDNAFVMIQVFGN